MRTTRIGNDKNANEDDLSSVCTTSDGDHDDDNERRVGSSSGEGDSEDGSNSDWDEDDEEDEEEDDNDGHDESNSDVYVVEDANNINSNGKKRKRNSSDAKKKRKHRRKTPQQKLWDKLDTATSSVSATHAPSSSSSSSTLSSTLHDRGSSGPPAVVTVAPHPLMPRSKPQAKKSTVVETLALPQFDFLKMRKDSNVYIVGKRNSGKNVYLAHWLQRLCSPYYATIPPQPSRVRQHYRGWISKLAVFSQTEKYNHFYRDVIGVPETFISTGYDADFLIRLMRVQKYLAEKLSKSSQKNFKHWLAIIVDDMGFEKALRTDKTLAEIMFCGRQFMVVLYYIAQDSLMANRDTRNCYDYVVCTRENTVEGQKRLHNNYYGLMKLEQFVPTMIRYTSNYSVLIADNTTNSGAIQDHYSWDRAPTDNFDNSDPRINGGMSTREMITLNYDDYVPFRKFLARRTDLTTGSAALFNRKTLAERFDILDAEMKADLVDFYREQDSYPQVQ
jgi:hypothetical protein